MPFRDIVSRHAMDEATLDNISLDEMEEAYIDPDFTRHLRTTSGARYEPDGSARRRSKSWLIQSTEEW